jgi:uncharacterized membrane protein YcaP (DUF421 family)
VMTSSQEYVKLFRGHAVVIRAYYRKFPHGEIPIDVVIERHHDTMLDLVSEMKTQGLADLAGLLLAEMETVGQVSVAQKQGESFSEPQKKLSGIRKSIREKLGAEG